MHCALGSMGTRCPLDWKDWECVTGGETWSDTLMRHVGARTSEACILQDRIASRNKD